MAEYKLTKRDGEVSMKPSFEAICSLLRNGEYTLSIKRKTTPRTLNQNALMWLWLKCLEEQTGQPKEDWRDYYAALFLGREVVVKDRVVRMPGHTSQLNTIQMTDFLKKVQADAATEWGVTLPLPEDRYFAEFVDEYKTR